MKLRQTLRFTAIGALLLYSIFRFVLVGATLSGYGVNPWVFFALDLATAAPYVIGVEMLVVGLVSKRGYSFLRTMGWGCLAGLSFALPYLYLFWAGNGLPVSMLIGLGVVVLLLLAGAILSIVRRVRRQAVK